MIFADGEILAQRGDADGGSRGLEIVEAALEELPVSENRESGGSPCYVFGSVAGGAEIGC